MKPAAHSSCFCVQVDTYWIQESYIWSVNVTLNVVYLDQCLGAGQSKCWLGIFFVQVFNHFLQHFDAKRKKCSKKHIFLPYTQSLDDRKTLV